MSQMIINYSDQPVMKNNKSIFLAGPTPRSVNVETWRKEALTILDELGFDGVVYVPEREFDDRTFDYDNQVTWEREALYAAGVIVFWIPREIEIMPAFTTNVEFGYWLGKGGKIVLYGRPDDSEKNRYLDWLYKTETNKTPHNDLKQLLSDAVIRITRKLNTIEDNILSIIDKFTLDNVTSFYPSSISKILDIPVEEARVKLMVLSLRSEGVCHMQYEIRHPEDATIIETVNDDEAYLGKTITCPKCKKEFVVDSSCIYPVFQVTEKYKQFLKKKKEQCDAE